MNQLKKLIENKIARNFSYDIFGPQVITAASTLDD